MNSKQQGGELEGRVVLVTGGGRGIGRVLAQKLADAGASVVVVARSSDQLAETVKQIEDAGGRAIAMTVDVSEPQAVADAIKQITADYGEVDVLVNNAGTGGPVGLLWEADTDEWWRTFDINVRGPHNCARAVLPGMIARRSGRIINVSSDAALGPWPGVSAYAISKAALLRYTEILAVEVRPHGISVFAIHPGFVRTDMPMGIAKLDVPPDSFARGIADGFRRAFEAGHDMPPEPAAQLVVLLASGRADALTGRFINVHDNIHELVQRAEQIQRDDLLTLRLRT